MNGWHLLGAQLRRRPLQTALSVLLLALGVGTLVFVLTMQQQFTQQMTRDARDVDLVVGAKGSPLQLVLSAVYHVDIPTGNVPLATVAQLRRNRLVKAAVPLALGDNVAGYRLVGTEPELIEWYEGRLARGALWAEPEQAVLGAEVARATGLDVGARFTGAHGLAAGGTAHEEDAYAVVGVLAPTGTVLDHLLLTGLESIWHAHEEKSAAGAAPDEAQREVTAILVRYATPLAAASLARAINTETNLMAAVPAAEVARLFAVAGVGIDVLRGFAAVLLLSALLALFVALTHALEERRYDLAILRLLGASRMRVGLLLLAEAWALAGVALVLGLAGGIGALALLARWSAQARSIRVDPLALGPDVAAVLLLGALVATLAAVVPAWRAARMNVHRTLAEG
jgi:putative ABC transport system permease protein